MVWKQIFQFEKRVYTGLGLIRQASSLETTSAPSQCVLCIITSSQRPRPVALLTGLDNDHPRFLTQSNILLPHYLPNRLHRSLVQQCQYTFVFVEKCPRSVIRSFLIPSRQHITISAAVNTSGRFSDPKDFLGHPLYSSRGHIQLEHDMQILSGVLMLLIIA